MIVECKDRDISEEKGILMQMKELDRIDKNNALGNWNISDRSLCAWNGVFCNNRFNVVQGHSPGVERGIQPLNMDSILAV